MTPAIAFTTARVEALECPTDAKRAYFRDARCTSLWLSVTANGARTFYVYRRVNGKPARIQIGPFPEVSVDKARKEADRIAGEIGVGKDPRAARRELRSGMTLKELFTDYLEMHAKPHKRTWQDDEDQFKRYLTKLQSRTLGEIDRYHVATLHAKIGRENGHYAANRLLALLQAMFAWAERERAYKGSNPARGIRKFKEEKRTRFLQPAEMPAFFKAVEAEPNEIIRDFVLIALYVGARRSNVQAMRWDELDLQSAVWTIPHTKNGKSALAPLCTPAVEILKRRHAARGESPFVFPGWGASGHLEEPKAAWKAILERAGLDNLRIHDLRRTFGSWQAVGGSSLITIGKSLGHSSTAATEIYARLHLDAVRKSIDAAVGAIVNAGKEGAK
jgi:integrase